MRLLFATISYQLWHSSATDISDMLNQKIAGSQKGTYNGGSNPGVMVRTVDFFDSGNDVQVKPATLWHNDIYAPSQMYPTVASPWCPNDGYDGFYPTSSCSDDPYSFATVAVVMAGSMDQMFQDFSGIQDENWGWGVFYASDANAVDKRCALQDGGWDCPGGWIDFNSGQFSQRNDKKGPGSYGAGNPDAGLGGGGAGCHFDSNANAIDQPDADAAENLVQDANCQCNYAYRSDWGDWVSAWVYHTVQKSGFENRDWLNGVNRAPAWGVDTAACWVNNPRDMINIQNALYWSRSDWNNQLIPKSDWNSPRTEQQRRYWGWNEIPVPKSVADDPMSWDAIIIKLPADVCATGDYGAGDNPYCLSAAAQQQLENDLEEYVNQNKLKLGTDNIAHRPGSYILFAKEYGTTYLGTTSQAAAGGGVNWSREFFCTGWVSPNGKYEVVSNDACYLDTASSPPPPPPPPPPPSGGCQYGDHVKCHNPAYDNGDMCAGDQCCPDGHTCPSARTWAIKHCQTAHYHCGTSSSLDLNANTTKPSTHQLVI